MGEVMNREFLNGTAQTQERTPEECESRRDSLAYDSRNDNSSANRLASFCGKIIGNAADQEQVQQLLGGRSGIPARLFGLLVQ